MGNEKKVLDVLKTTYNSQQDFNMASNSKMMARIAQSNIKIESFWYVFERQVMSMLPVFTIVLMVCAIGSWKFSIQSQVEIIQLVTIMDSGLEFNIFNFLLG